MRNSNRNVAKVFIVSGHQHPSCLTTLSFPRSRRAFSVQRRYRSAAAPTTARTVEDSAPEVSTSTSVEKEKHPLPIEAILASKREKEQGLQHHSTKAGSTPSSSSSTSIVEHQTTSTATLTGSARINALTNDRHIISSNHVDRYRRYLPTEGGAKFLIDDERLTPSERRWQRFFAVLPWATFGILAATPFLLMQYIEEQKKSRRTGLVVENTATIASSGATETATVSSLAGTSSTTSTASTSTGCRGLENIKFPEMVDVVENMAAPSVVFLHSGALTFHSALVRNLVETIAELFRKYELQLRCVALDHTGFRNTGSTPAGEGAVPEMNVVESSCPLDTEYPPACGPFLQIIRKGDVHDYTGPFVAKDIALWVLQTAGLSHLPCADEIVEEAMRTIDPAYADQKDKLIEQWFINEDREEAAHGAHHGG
ncbi:unnamed protein product [Amoebophrya sp. A25]|nr:unnamed protein product [Amoebophrya sp. A25]|eukprot:GSA25T00019853001.1